MKNMFQFSKGAVSLWTIIILIAVLAVVLAEGILIGQLFRVTKKDVPALKETTEQQAAQYVLDKFMEARIAGRKDQALIYLTENAMEQYSQAEFDMLGNFKSFEVLKSEKLEEAKFRFLVRTKEENDLDYFIEAVTVVKILDRYYIDSIQLAG